MKGRILGSVLFVACGTAFAQTSDLDALKLADTAVANVDAPRDWQWFVEAAVGQILADDGLGSMANNRWSTNFQLNTALTDRFRFVMGDRLDVTSKNNVTGQSAVNTLKEAYVSWQIDKHRFIDVGRIKQLYGAAIGYNPTDYFRTGARFRRVFAFLVTFFVSTGITKNLPAFDGAALTLVLVVIVDNGPAVTVPLRWLVGEDKAVRPLRFRTNEPFDSNSGIGSVARESASTFTKNLKVPVFCTPSRNRRSRLSPGGSGVSSVTVPDESDELNPPPMA